MFRRIFFAALLTGFIGGAVVSLVQTYTTTPIILLAEQYETGGDKDNHHQGFLDRHINLVSPVLAHDGKTSSPTVNLERSLTTLLANILMGFGFALILTACYAISGKRVDGRHGVLWGLSGFGIVSLAPALGLPPELPGTLSAELGMRQGWWFLCVAATALGLWGMVYRSGPVWLAYYRSPSTAETGDYLTRRDRRTFCFRVALYGGNFLVCAGMAIRDILVKI